jgi:hypothetical protein
MPAKPKPDEYGRIRVVDQETGHERSVHEAEYAHGKYKVADNNPATDLSGDPVPPVHGSLSSKSTSGQSADTKKE